MPHLDHTAFVNSCRDERGVGHHTLRAYAQDLRTLRASPKTTTSPIRCRKMTSSPTTAICAMSWTRSRRPSSGGL